jgi:dTMP kinase
METKGKLIVIEGLDGAGTTTQTNNLTTWLKTKGYYVKQTKEPTAGPAGMLIRLALVGRLEFDKKTLAMLFLGDRMDHQFKKSENIVESLIESNSVVVSDRYYLSSLAYQTLETDITIDWLMQIHHHCIRPNLTIFLDVPPDECIRRITVNRGSHFELFEMKNLLITVRENYLKAITVLRNSGENIQIINGEGTLEQVEERIRIRTESLLSGGSPTPN